MYFQNNKSPGEDGLTKEFYVCFWNEIKTKYYSSWLESKVEGQLAHSQTVGVITLLEKKGKSRLEVGNWRPITLLNFDYKLLSKTIANRIKSVLGKIGAKMKRKLTKLNAHQFTPLIQI